MFLIFGIVISLFLSGLLLLKKHKSHADKILLVWLLFMAFHQSIMYFQISGSLNSYPHLLGISFPFPVIQGLMLFIYVAEITGNRFKKKWYFILHLLPALSLVILAIPFYALDGSEKLLVFKNEGEGFEWYMTYINLLIGISGTVYSIWSLLLIQRYRLNLKNSLSNVDKKELKWLQYLSTALGFIWLLSFFVDNSIIYPAVVIFIILIGFFGINQLDIFYSIPDQVIMDKFEADAAQVRHISNKTKRYAKSGLDEDKANLLYLKLQELMTKGELYKDPNLTLKELAEKLACSPNYLSQVINEKKKVNFYSYVNNLRISEFIQKMNLPENKKYTLMSVAHDCGFSNKSTFNRHFKKTTGQTPSDFFKSEEIIVEQA